MYISSNETFPHMNTLSKMNMCGIIGIISKENRELIPEAILGLRDLEYRGYDSAGLGFIDGKILKTYKCLGAPSEKLLEEDVYSKTNTKIKTISTIIGHTRWATHGKPTLKNAHPHIDCENNIAIVHNGTILNYESIKHSLIHLGHVFTSETDSEVLSHLIEEFYSVYTYSNLEHIS